MKRVLASVAIVLLTTGARQTPEKWFDAYARGVKAVNAKSYAAGAEALQAAIAEMPNEGVSVRAGNVLITYVPHFWLGIAKFNLGDVDGALREWHTAEEQGVINRTDYYSGMKDWIARAQTEKTRKAESAAKGPKTAADAAINRALATQTEAFTAGGDRTETYRSASRKLQEALGQFNKAGTNAAAFNTAAETAGQATALFTRSAEEAKALKLARANAPKPKPPVVVQQQVVPPIQKPVEVVVPFPGPVATATVAPAPAPVQQPAEPEVESEASVAARLAVQSYRGTVAKGGREDKADAGIQSFVRAEGKQADRLRDRLARAKDDAERQRIATEAAERNRTFVQHVNELRVSAVAAAALATPVENKSDAKAGLQMAYRAFAAGDLSTSEQLLTKLVTEAPTAEAFLLRGCVRYTRAMLSRAPDTLRADAATDFRAAVQRNSMLRLEGRLFSPKLVTFFDEVRKTAR
jgi:tetratricopeptide (TPR) repeat protein